MSQRVQVFEGEVQIRRESDADVMYEGPVGTRGFRIKLFGARLLILAAALVAWEIIGGDYVDTFWISQPSDIYAKLAKWLVSGTLGFQLAVTLQEMLIGFTIGAVAGLVTGFVLGRNEFLSRLLDPFIAAIYSLPKVALAPLFILWFGVDIKPKIVLAAVVVFFLVFYNTYAGVRDVDSDLVDMVRLMGGNRFQILFFVVLPSSLIWIFTGLKLAVPYALIGAVVGEIMASNRGIGYLIEASAGQFDTAGVFAALFVLMIISVTLNELLNRAEGFLLRWKSTGQ
jgi:NitT/TauT family transport system permease protein